MASLFISYSRKDIETARKLTQAFEGQGLDFWIDWEGIPPTVDWWNEIQKGIEEADIFLFLLSPDAVTSKVCKWEIEHAAKNGKRLIPIIVRDIKGNDSPSELSQLNWIFLRENDDFDSGLKKLITAIQTDYAWVKSHRELQVKALEWERSNKENSFLLRGKELQDAEFQLATNSSKEPNPTDLQREYVFKSRQATNKQRRTTTSIAIGGIIALAALAVYGFVQAGLTRIAEATAISNASRAETEGANAIDEANRRATAQADAEANQTLADERAKISRAGELAAQSVALHDTDFLVSLLLGVEAFNTSDTIQTRGALIDNALANPQLLAYLSGISNPIAFSPDGNTLAGISNYDTIIFWDVTTRQPIGQQIRGHTIGIASVAFSPDGKMLASGGLDHTVRLWDAETGQPIGQPLSGHTENVYGVAFSPDGKLLASGSQEGITILWDVSTLLNTKEGQEESIRQVSIYNTDNLSIVSVAFSPDGKVLASGGTYIYLWDVKTGEPIGQPLNANSQTIAFSPDGKILASGGGGYSVTLWDVKTGQPVGQPLIGHTNSVESIAFSPDGKILASGSFDNTIILWDAKTGQQIGLPLRGHSGVVSSVAFSPDGSILASGSWDSTTILWNVKTVVSIGQLLSGNLGWISSIAISPDGKTLAAGGLLRNIVLWDVDTGRSIGQPLSGHTEDVISLAFSPDGITLASGSRDSTIILWDVKTGQRVGQPLSEHTGAVSSVAFSPDGKMLVSGSWDNSVILWDVDTRQPIGVPLGKSTAADTYGTVVAFSPDGKTLALARENLNGPIILWDVETGQQIGLPLNESNPFVSSLAFSPDGKILASAGTIIILLDVESGQPIGEPMRHTLSISSVAFSPDGKTLASGSTDNTIILWDVETRQPIGFPLRGHSDQVTSVAFSPDGKKLASGSWDDTVILWFMDPVAWIEKTCQRAHRNFTRAEWAQYFPEEEYRITCPQWQAGE